MSTNTATLDAPTKAAIGINYDKKVYVELPAQSYLARVSNRPALAAINGLVSSFPVIKIFSSNAVPVLVAREQAQQQKQQAS